MAIEVLKALAQLGGAATLSQLAVALEENPAKVHRYLASLVEGDMVTRELTTARYALGPGSIAVGLAAMRQSDVVTLADPELVRLAEVHGLSCFLAVLGNKGPTIVRWREPLHPVTVNVKVGSVIPVLWSATGRAFAAFKPSADVDAWIKEELRTATPFQKAQTPSRAQVAAQMADVRRDGCASIKDLLLVGISAVAAPIFDADGGMVAALTALGPTGSFDADPSGGNALQIKAAAMTLSVRLGAGGTRVAAGDAGV